MAGYVEEQGRRLSAILREAFPEQQRGGPGGDAAREPRAPQALCGELLRALGAARADVACMAPGDAQGGAQAGGTGVPRAPWPTCFSMLTDSSVFLGNLLLKYHCGRHATQRAVLPPS